MQPELITHGMILEAVKLPMNIASLPLNIYLILRR